MTTVAVEIPEIIPLEHPVVPALAKWLCEYEAEFHQGERWDRMSETGRSSWEQFAATTINDVVTPNLVKS